VTPNRIQPWQTIKSRIIHQTPWFRIREDQVQIQKGTNITFTYLDHPGAVIVVPITFDGDCVLINQFRYTVKEWCLEVPCGALEQEEDYLQTARRELLEETGGICERFVNITSFYACNGSSNIKCNVVLAEGVRLGKPNPEKSELIKVMLKSKNEVLEMAKRGEIKDGMSALAILLCDSYW
jgi:ADP-ribose pyrophosphatase